MLYTYNPTKRRRQLKPDALDTIQKKISQLEYGTDEIYQLALIRNLMIDLLEGDKWNPKKSLEVLSVEDYTPKDNEEPEIISHHTRHHSRLLILKLKAGSGEIIEKRGLWKSYSVKKGDKFYILINHDWSDVNLIHEREHEAVYQLALDNIPSEYLETIYYE